MLNYLIKTCYPAEIRFNKFQFDNFGPQFIFKKNKFLCLWLCSLVSQSVSQSVHVFHYGTTPIDWHYSSTQGNSRLNLITHKLWIAVSKSLNLIIIIITHLSLDWHKMTWLRRDVFILKAVNSLHLYGGEVFFYFKLDWLTGCYCCSVELMHYCVSRADDLNRYRALEDCNRDRGGLRF